MTDSATDDAMAEGGAASAVTDSTEQPRQQATRAPYMSHPAFKRLYTETLRGGNVPARFDKSYFGNVSGSLIAQVRGTLRYFDLIDDQQQPTPLLMNLVSAIDETAQKAILRPLVEEKYADALALSLNATVGQLADVFRQRGISGNTVQKAIAFYVSVAEDVGIEVSPLYKKGRMTASTGNGTRKKRAPKPPTPTTPAPAHSAKVPTAEEQRAKYVSMLMDLVQKNESDVQESLLDRIEKTLGIDSPVPESRGSDVPKEE